MTATIFGLWRNWAVATGILAAVVFVVPLVSHLWQVAVGFAGYLALQWVRAILRRRQFPSCSRLVNEVSIVLCVTAFFMLAFEIYARLVNHPMHEITGQPMNLDSTFLVVLFTAPLTVIITAVFYFRRGEPDSCLSCKSRYGSVLEHGFVGDLFRREWRYQTRLLLMLSLLLTVVDWGYYMIHYVNTNINQADLFYFLALPLIIYVLSLVYLGVRYYSIWIYYVKGDKENILSRGSSTTLRFLIISEDDILLTRNASDDDRYDSPVAVHVSYHESENITEARNAFLSATGIKDVNLRFIYESPDKITYQNTFHYFAFLPKKEEIEGSKVKGEWYGIGRVRQMLRRGQASRSLVAEMSRIYNVAMAWKTYSPSGKRLYPIRNYRPTFHFRDLSAWDVDYDDFNWLRVSRHNQDKPFFWLWKLKSRLVGTSK